MKMSKMPKYVEPEDRDARAFYPADALERTAYTNMHKAQQEAFHGSEAVMKVQELIGRDLTPQEINIVYAEGYSPNYYLDTSDIVTKGVGQTSDYMTQDYDDVMAAKDKELRDYIHDYDNLNPRLQDALFSNNYRGILGDSDKTRRLINKGEYNAAAVEFLDSDEYRAQKAGSGIKARYEETAAALREQGGTSSWMDGINQLGREATKGFKDTFRPAKRAYEDFTEGASDLYESAKDKASELFGGVEQQSSGGFDEISPTRFAGHIAYENGMTLDELQSLNPEVEITRGSMGRALQSGQKLRVGNSWYENLA